MIAPQPISILLLIFGCSQWSLATAGPNSWNPNQELDPESSPLSKAALQKRQEELAQEFQEAHMARWKRKVRLLNEPIDQWEANQLFKRSKNDFSPLKGGSLWEEDFGRFELRIGTWGHR